MNFGSSFEEWLTRFRSSPYSLRFELGGESFGNILTVPRFVQAFSRAAQVMREVFDGSAQVFGIVAEFSNPAGDLFAPADDGFEALAAAGFTSPHLREWQAPMWPDQVEEEDRMTCRWRMYDLSGDDAQRDVLLWCAVSYEMAITPKAPVSSFLVDPDRNIHLHVYDDRGMDVTALDRASLLHIYRSRQDWLLDYDRRRMREAFGEPG